MKIISAISELIPGKHSDRKTKKNILKQLFKLFIKTS